MQIFPGIISAQPRGEALEKDFWQILPFLMLEKKRGRCQKGHGTASVNPVAPAHVEQDASRIGDALIRLSGIVNRYVNGLTYFTIKFYLNFMIDQEMHF
jgi:hypothetical protein